MGIKEDEFKSRFMAIMQNVRKVLPKDREAQWLIGSLAANFIDKTGQQNWVGYKNQLSQRAYEQLLADLEREGGRYHEERKEKQAFAVQLLAASVVARTQKDADLRTGGKLLDDVIDLSVETYRRNKADVPLAAL